ncbi:MAG: TetR/AcrR family transcriptional regulator [Pseudomonadota bacterium]
MPRTKGKEPLSQEKILLAAVKYADQNGIDKLNIRQLATLLNSGAMSLYYYFSSKGELLDAMVEFVAAQIETPDPNATWRDGIARLAMSAHEAMGRHPWVCRIWSKQTLGPNRLAFMESVLRVLRQNGFSIADAYEAYCAITVHIEGSALQAAEFPLKPKDYQRAAAAFLESVDASAPIPYFIENVRYRMEHADLPDQFTLVLDMILNGFEARLAHK